MFLQNLENETVCESAGLLFSLRHVNCFQTGLVNVCFCKNLVHMAMPGHQALTNNELIYNFQNCK